MDDLRINYRISICRFSVDRFIISTMKLQEWTRGFWIVVQVLYHLGENNRLATGKGALRLEVHQNGRVTKCGIRVVIRECLLTKQEITRLDG